MVARTGHRRSRIQVPYGPGQSDYRYPLGVLPGPVTWNDPLSGARDRRADQRPATLRPHGGRRVAEAEPALGVRAISETTEPPGSAVHGAHGSVGTPVLGPASPPHPAGGGAARPADGQAAGQAAGRGSANGEAGTSRYGRAVRARALG